jgi:hypothetical protein
MEVNLTVFVFLSTPFVIWCLLHLKASRPDGTVVSRVHPYRKVVYSLNRTKAASQVGMELRINAEPLLAYIQQFNEVSPAHLTVHHCVIAAVNYTLAKNPEMDRFVMGGRLYQRKERSISFTVKKVKRDRRAALGTVKLVMNDDENFETLINRLIEVIARERENKPTSVDKEMIFLNRIPAPLLNLGIRIGYWLNNRNWLPAIMLNSDVMHTSAFVANLGSVGIPAAYHHLYEWGTCPIFLTLSDIELAPMVEHGEVVVRKTLVGKFTFDERVADGLTAWETIQTGLKSLERPEHFFKSLQPIPKTKTTTKTETAFAIQPTQNEHHTTQNNRFNTQLESSHEKD